MDYEETTLDEFKERALLTVQGQKAAVTICFKGLSHVDQMRAHWWMQDRWREARDQARIYQMHLKVDSAKVAMREAVTWRGLLDRL